MTDYRNDYTGEAIKARGDAAAAGRFAGTLLLVQMREIVDNAEGMTPDFDPYLEYLIYQNAAQVILNEGRRIGGLDFKKGDNELEGRKR